MENHSFTFTWVLDVHTLVFMFIQEALCLWSHPHSGSQKQSPIIRFLGGIIYLQQVNFWHYIYMYINMQTHTQWPRSDRNWDLEKNSYSYSRQTLRKEENNRFQRTWRLNFILWWLVVMPETLCECSNDLEKQNFPLPSTRTSYCPAPASFNC